MGPQPNGQQPNSNQQPMKELYSVKITYDVMVMADDFEDAHSVASKNREAIVNDDKNPSIEVQDCIEGEEYLDEDYDNTFLYGDNPKNLTCLEIVRKKKEVTIDNLSEEEKELILSRLTAEQIRELLDL
jgi:hypothetical protein